LKTQGFDFVFIIYKKKEGFFGLPFFSCMLYY